MMGRKRGGWSQKKGKRGDISGWGRGCGDGDEADGAKAKGRDEVLVNRVKVKYGGVSGGISQHRESRTAHGANGIHGWGV